MLRLKLLFGLVFTPWIPINTVSKVTNLRLTKLRASLALRKILKLKNIRPGLKKLSQLPFRLRQLRPLKPAKKRRKTVSTAAENKELKELKAPTQLSRLILLSPQIRSVIGQTKTSVRRSARIAMKRAIIQPSALSLLSYKTNFGFHNLLIDNCGQHKG